MSFKQFVRRFGKKSNHREVAQPTLAPGLYHYLRENLHGKVRLHLRIEQDGRGLLSANAAQIYHLNPTAAFMAYAYLEGRDPDDAVNSLCEAYQVPPIQARQDFTAFYEQMAEIVSPEGACPLCDLELETTAPFSDRPSAPYRMDLALTYRCSNDCAHCYNALPRERSELTADEWKQTLDRVWAAGIPHVVFTGGEPTLRPDLPDLVAYAQQLGMITGLNTNGRRLKDRSYLNKLAAAGLDHVQITLESHDPEIHDAMVTRQGAWIETVAGVKNSLASKLYVMTNTTLLQANSSTLPETLDFLAGLGVPTVGLNALIYSGKGATVGSGLPESSLPPLLETARHKTDLAGQRLIWYTPTQYCHFDPQMLELGVKGCTAALYNMCIEPDGGVLPCQSYYHPLGSMLHDPWESIWNHDLAVALRERRNIPSACKSCLFLPECGGGCPLAWQECKTSTPHPVDPLRIGGME